MSVLDGSIVQLQFRRRGTSGVRVFFAYAPQVLLDGLFADGHLPGHGFHRQTRRVELQRTPFLVAESRPVGGVIGSEDVGPVPARGNLPDRRTYLAGLLVLQPGLTSATATGAANRPAAAAVRSSVAGSESRHFGS